MFLSFAYRFFETTGNPPKPFRWWHRSAPLVFHVATVARQEIPLADVPAIMKAAFDTWTNTPCHVVPEVISAAASI